MRIFVTGGAGYVGSACLRHLAAEGHSVLAFDNLSEGHRAAVVGAELVEGELADEPHLVDCLRRFRPEAVMHFAAATYVGESVSNPEFHYRNNIAGTLALLRSMKEAGVQRILFSSTCATYGLAPACPMNEETPQAPFSPYARTKLAVEWMLQDFADPHELGFTILRYFNAAGASPDGEHGEDHRPETHLIPLVLAVPLGRRECVQLYGSDYPTPDGTCIRDYIHVQDLATAHLLAIEATHPKTRAVYNVGTGQGHSVRQIMGACEAVSGQRIRVEIVDRRPGDPPALVADATKLQRALGWRPRFRDIREIVDTAWRWHRAHPDGYQDG